MSEAAREQIKAANFNEIEKYLEPNYSQSMLIDWATNRFGVELTTDELAGLSISAASNLLFRKVEEVYTMREIRWTKR